MYKTNTPTDQQGAPTQACPADLLNEQKIDQVKPAKKWCSMCDRVKPTSEFHHNAGRWDGLAHRCKVCRAKYRAGRTEQSRAGQRRRRAAKRAATK